MRTVLAAAAAAAAFGLAAPVAGAAILVPGGPPVAVEVTAAGDVGTATFEGVAGSRASLEVVDVTIGTSACCSTKVSILKPDGKTLVSTTLGTNGGFLDAVVLPVTGTYTVVVDPSSINTGAATLRLYDVPVDDYAATTTGAGPVTLGTTTPGQNATLTFPATAGDRISLTIADVTIGTSVCCSTKISLLRPDGRQLATTTVGTNGGFFDAQTLPGAGTYTVLVDPQGTSTGGVTLELQAVPADATGTISADGTTVTATTTVPGQNAQLTFSGTAGHRASLVALPDCCTLRITIVRPDGKTLATTTAGTAGGFVDAVALPATGTYTILLDPQGVATGLVDVRLYDVPADVTAAGSPGGEPVTLSTTTPGQNGTLTFDGIGGRRVAIAVAPGCCSTRVSILKPNGQTLVAPVSVSSFGGFVDTAVLPSSGTYTVSVDPQGAATGDVVLTLYDVPADVAVTVTPGAPLTVSLTTPGQNARLTFDGTAGDRISLRVGASCCSTKITLAKPNGSALASLFASPGGGFLDVTTLPTSGTYSILVDPQAGATGDVALTLYEVPGDVTATVAADGSPATLTTTTPGQNARLTFGGSVGQRVSLLVSGACCNAQVSLVKPDDTTLASISTFGAGGFLDTQTLPMTGTYTVLVDLTGATTGSVTVALFSVAPDVAATIAPLESGGSPVPVAIVSPGQNARLTFAGTAGGRVSVDLSNVTIGTSTFSGTRVSILAPDGSSVGTAVTVGTNGGLIDTVALPTNGTYAILVDPQGANTGGITVALHGVPADVTASIIPGGAPLSLTISSPGQNARVAFTGTAGQRVSLALTGVTIGTSTCCGVRISLLDPAGTTLGAPTSVGMSGGFVDAAVLPADGTYEILVDPQGTSTGNITLQLYDVPADASAAAVPGGAAVSVTTTVPGQNAIVAFDAAAGARVSLRVGPTCCIDRVVLLAPNGSTLAGPMSFGAGGGFIDTVTLLQTGTYTLALDASGTALGSRTVTVYAVPANASGSLTTGSSLVLTTTVPGQNAVATFTGSAGDGMKLTVGPFNCCSTQVSVLDPGGAQLVAPTSFNPDGGALLTRLPAAGAYTVVVDPQGAGVGALNLSLAFDNTAPDPPVLTLATASPDSFVSGTTFFYRPSGAGGSFTVSAVTNDGGAGLQKVRFPGLAGGFTPTSSFDDLLSQYAQTYSWTTGASFDSPANTVTAFDRVGNTSASSFGVTPDSAPPSTSDNTTALGSAWKNTTQTVVLSPLDGTGSGPAATYATSDGSTPTLASPQGTSVTLSAEGVYTVRYFSVDHVGNTESVRTAGTAIRIDKTVPSVATLNTLPATIRNGQALGASGADALSGVASVTYLYCPGGACTPSLPVATSTAGPSYLVTWPAMPADGTYQVLARVQDAAGNTRDSAKQTVTIDNTAPNTTVTGAPATPTNATAASFSFTATEAGSTFECRLDGGGFATCSSPKGYSGLAAGSHTFEVRATDAVGNVDPTPASFTWTIDLTPPDTTITGGPSSPTAGTTAVFSFASSEMGSSFQCRLDGGTATSCTSPKTYTGVTEGPHTVSVTAVDAAGNPDPTPAAYSWTVDLTPPDTTITSGPPSPTSSTGATFSFSASEPGSSFACQLDGAGFAPCSFGISYSGLAAGGHVFQVKATDPAGNTDATAATWAWTIDTTPPDTTITAAPANPSNATAASFSFAASESGSTFQCSLDGGGFAGCTSPVSYAGLAPGSHTFGVRAVDAAANVDPTQASFTWTIDTSAPESTLSSGPGNPTSSTGATFAFTSDEAGATFQCSLDGGGYAACSSPKTYAGLLEAAHSLWVRAVDPAGNVDPTPATWSWTVDLTPPETTISAHPVDPSSSTGASFAFASEAGASLECQLDGGGWTACTSPVAYSGISPGSHTFAVRATDAAGNVDPSPATFTWTIDTSPPQTTIVSGPSGSTSQTAASFDFGSSEPGSVFECSLDAAAFAACTAPRALSGLAEGSHIFEVRAIDPAGNVDSTPASRTWTIDTTAPAPPLITAPANGAVVNASTITLAGTSEPGSTVQLFDGATDMGQATAAGDGSWAKALTGVPDGTHVYTATATDAAGNTSAASASRTVVVDTTAPNTVIGTGPLGSTPSTTASFTFSATEPSSTFECSLDGAAFSNCSSPRTYSSLAEGSHTFQARATDGAGNADPTPASRTWTVDTTAPAPPALALPADGAVLATSSVTVSGTAEPGAIVEVFDGASSKGTTTANGSGAWSRTLSGVADGSHVYTAAATDAAGNTSAASASHTIVVDTVAPDTTVDSGPASPTVETTATFNFSSSETGSTFECSLDGAPFFVCSSPLVVDPVATGDHVFGVRAVDAAGNVDPTPASHAWTVQ